MQIIIDKNSNFSHKGRGRMNQTKLAMSITGAGRETILSRRVLAICEDQKTIAVLIPGKNTIRLGVPTAQALAEDLLTAIKSAQEAA